MFTNTLISNLRAWHNRGLVSRELSAMSDRQLADIGIDIEICAHRSFLSPIQANILA